LSLQEKNFIEDEIFLRHMYNMNINWRKLVKDIERKYGRRHGDRKLKIYWYEVQKYQRKITGMAIEPPFVPTFDDYPFKMQPI